MFYFVLGCSLVLLLITNLIAFFVSKPLSQIIQLSVFFGLITVMGMSAFPPFMFQCLAIAAIAIVWKTKLTPDFSIPFSPVCFLVASCSVTVIIYGYTCNKVERELTKLQAIHYPFAPIEDRVPIPDRSKNRFPLTAETLRRLDGLEARRDDEEVGERVDPCKWLYEKSFDLFVMSGDFGFVGDLTDPWMEFDWDKRVEERIIPQPNLRDHPAWSLGDPGRPISLDSRSQTQLLNDTIMKFATDGHARDRHRVAGYRPHFFVSVPRNPVGWRVQSIELVSLLLHPEPVVYVSKELPRLRKLREGPTRPLDEFETYALSRIRQGDYLVTSPTSEGTSARMLGAIYNLKQCVKCHGGERGDLLGAFSYDLELAQP